LKYKAVIFDLDGVICYTDKYHYEAWKKVADKLGIYFDEEINNRLRGVSRQESLNIILENYKGKMSEEEKYLYTDEKNAIYKALLQGLSPRDLSEEVRDTLMTLRNRGIKLAIGSSSKNTGLILEQIGLGDFFDAISDGNGIANSKPDPEVFLRAAKRLNIPPCDCLVVEDAKAGIEAAKAGGMDSCGIGSAVIDAKATYHVYSLTELVEII
jgi:beta-phosphoglucomutase